MVNLQQNYGTAIGINIENLIIKAPSPVTAFVHGVIEPLKALFDNGFTQQVVILVDSLDEASQFTGGETIVNLLANTAGLSPQVRFVLTTRDDPSVLDFFDSQEISGLLLDAREKQNQEDIKENFKLLNKEERNALVKKYGGFHGGMKEYFEKHLKGDTKLEQDQLSAIADILEVLNHRIVRARAGYYRPGYMWGSWDLTGQYIGAPGETRTPNRLI